MDFYVFSLKLVWAFCKGLFFIFDTALTFVGIEQISSTPKDFQIIK